MLLLRSDPTEGTEVYLNTSFSDWYVPIFLVHEKETGSPFVCTLIIPRPL